MRDCVPVTFVFPRHYVRESVDFIHAFQPSVVKAFASVTSPEWWRDVAQAAPNAILVLVHGEISDNPDMSHPERDAEDTARLVDQRPGFPRLVITKNELLQKAHPYEHWQWWAQYHTRWFTRAHQLGLNGVGGQIFSGHLNTYLLDQDNQWERLQAVEDAMNQGDYWGLHEYWGGGGRQAWWPWTIGRHMTCPTRHNILLDECGYDRFTQEYVADKHQRGWVANLSPDEYVSQLVEYHQMITDPRVKGTAIFLLDFDNNEWQSFDTWPIRDRLLARRGEFDLRHPYALMPSRLHFPLASYVKNPDGSPRITQTFAQHPAPAKGLDISCPTGSPVLCAAEGIVDKVVDLGDTSYGKYIQVNHWWGFTLYAHLSRMDVQKGQLVAPGSVLGASGDTGKSTGPHLHFEVKSLAERQYPHRVDPAPLIGIGGSIAPTPDRPATPESLTTEDMQRCADALGLVPATIKAAVARDYVWLKELYTPGDKYALALVWDRARQGYRALKLDARDWRLVGDEAL